MSKPIITKEQIEELEAARKATGPEPWKPDVWYGHLGGWAAVGPVHEEESDEDDFEPGCVSELAAQRDSKFITLAHQHVPALIARVRELEAKYEATQKAAGLAGNVSIDRNRELIACRKDEEPQLSARQSLGRQILETGKTPDGWGGNDERLDTPQFPQNYFTEPTGKR